MNFNRANGQRVAASPRALALRVERARLRSDRELLGQYYSGLSLGRLVASLAIATQKQPTVVDPMAGHGDLLDAAVDVARQSEIDLQRVDGVDIEERDASICRERLMRYRSLGFAQRVVAADIFNPRLSNNMPFYSTVLLNPPHARYRPRRTSWRTPGQLLAAVRQIATSRLEPLEHEIWVALIDALDAQVDLAVPACIMATTLVAPHGHLAVVLPADWRLRTVFDPFRYLLLRCFSIKYIVEDAPGLSFFSPPFERTQIIVARRLSAEKAMRSEPTHFEDTVATWARIGPDARTPESLVGKAFPGGTPETAFLTWLGNGAPGHRLGIETHPFNSASEWNALHARAAQCPWYRTLGGKTVPRTSPRTQRPAAEPSAHNPASIPAALKSLIPWASTAPDNHTTLQKLGMSIGQGFRSGCNAFFYVSEMGICDDGAHAVVELAPIFGIRQIQLPVAVLRPVLHRDYQTSALRHGAVPPTRLLDLRGWALPEDIERNKSGWETLPRVMCDDLAQHVRRAARTPASPGRKTFISEIPHVQANQRKGRDRSTSSGSPRFWYTIPDLAPRHMPQAFLPRIAHRAPRSDLNIAPPLVVDSNFCTLWDDADRWEPASIRAFLNSAWCAALLELTGTESSGGSIKLETFAFRSLPVPPLSEGQIQRINVLSVQPEDVSRTQIDAIVFEAVAKRPLDDDSVRTAADSLRNLVVERVTKRLAAAQRPRFPEKAALANNA